MNVGNLYTFPPAERGRCSPNVGGKNPSMEHFYTSYRLYLTIMFRDFLVPGFGYPGLCSPFFGG